MKKIIYSLTLTLLTLLCSMTAMGAVTIQETNGWFESGYVTWAREPSATYTVYYRPAGGAYVKMDKELVRLYSNYGRADMVGLKAGQYQFKIVSSTGSEAESDVFYAAPYDRSGFAHVGMTGGIGAYKNDGTLKDNARVLYVTAKTAKTVALGVMKGGKETQYTGIQAIIGAYEGGGETRPLCVRFVGTVKAADLDAMNSNEGLQVKGKSGSTDMNVTLEGIGCDATVHGFGFLVRNAKSVEFRNFGIMLFLDDGISVDTDNHNVWIHNMDIFYGGTGSDADQAKGDGSVDIKGKSSNITMSYCHFWDSGKCSLGGMKGETTDCWMTFHHNWFDHSDSRHPRIRTAFYHVYNNYFDGNSKYGVGVTSGGSSFVENNYFRNCKYPVLISKQGTDAEGDGTFSGEDGGVNKIFNNIIINPRKVQLYDGEQTDGKWDAVEVDNRSDEVTVKCLTGGTGYNNTADKAARTTYIENNIDDPEDIPAAVRGELIGREGLGAGRMQGGDFKWTFNNSLQDENYGVISDLKTSVVSYEGTVQSFGDGTAISDRTPATDLVDGGDGKGLDQEQNDEFTPSWAGGSGTAVASGKQVIGENDGWFWFNTDNDTQYKAYVNAGTIILSSGASYKPEQTIVKSDKTSCSDYVGSIRLANGESITLYNAGGISTAAFYVSSTGDQAWQLSTSTDGKTFTNSGSVITGKSGTHPNAVYTGTDATVKYVRITNTNSSTRDVQGVKLYSPLAESDLTALTTETIEIKNGSTYTLTKGTDYTTSCTGAISYKSSSAKIASVDENGKITALAEGNTTITMTQKGDDVRNGGTLKFKVTVTDTRDNSDLTLNSDAEITVELGSTASISATCSNPLTYTSGAPSIATVDAEGNITAVGFGTAKITISDPGSTTNRPGTAVVTVNVPDNRPASSLKAVEELTLERGTATKLEPTGAVGKVNYSSVDETVATVDADGNVTAVGEGETTISITDEGDNTVKAGVWNVTVKVTDQRKPNTLSVSPTSIEIEMEKTMTATLVIENAIGSVSYASSNEKVATVSNGTIKAVSGGEAVITVYAAGNEEYKGDSVQVNVSVIPVPSLDPVTWNLTNASYTQSGTFSANATNIFVSTDGSNTELTYVAGGNCKIEAGKQMKMGGSTQYSSTPNRYFVLPKLSGSGTLTIEFGDNANEVKLATSVSKTAVAIATLDGDEVTAELKGLKATETYYLLMDPKSYFKTITWTPNAATADEEGDDDDPTDVGDYSIPEPTVIYDWKNKVGATTLYSVTDAGNVAESTVKVNNVSTACVKFAKTIGFSDTLKVSPDYCMVVKAADGKQFQKGDTIRLLGCINNSKDSKYGTTWIYNNTKAIIKPENFANTNTTTVNPVIQEFVLDIDCDSLTLGRNGNTATCLLNFTVLRPANVTLGDVNNDGQVTMADANMVVNYFLADDKDSLGDFPLYNADINGDKQITMADANQIVNSFLAGKDVE